MSTNKDDFYHIGLTDNEVLQSREKNGINLLTPPKRPSLWKLYLEKFEDPVVRVLLVAAAFSLFSGWKSVTSSNVPASGSCFRLV